MAVCCPSLRTPRIPFDVIGLRRSVSAVLKDGFNTRQREILTFHSSANEICIYTRRFNSDAIASRAAYSWTVFIQFILLSFVVLLLLLLLVFFSRIPGLCWYSPWQMAFLTLGCLGGFSRALFRENFAPIWEQTRSQKRRRTSVAPLKSRLLIM